MFKTQAALYLSVGEKLALLLPGETMESQHVMQLLPRQTEAGIIRVRVGVCGVVAQQDVLQEAEEQECN